MLRWRAGAGGGRARADRLIVLYDAWHKGNALSPLLMAGCRALVYVVAGFAVAAALNRLWRGAAAAALTSSASRRLPRPRAAAIAARWPVLAVLAPAAYWAKELPDAGGRAAARGLPALDRRRALARARAARIGAGVVRLIAGIAIYDALVVAGAGGGAAGAGGLPRRLRCHDRSPDQDRGDRRWLHKTVVLCTVALTPELLGDATPRLKAFADAGAVVPLGGVTPAVTATVQSTYLTGAAAERARRGRQRLAVPGHDGGAALAAVEPARAGAEGVGGGAGRSPARTSAGGSRCTRRPTSR